jgi:hypothetical protein
VKTVLQAAGISRKHRFRLLVATLAGSALDYFMELGTNVSWKHVKASMSRRFDGKERREHAHATLHSLSFKNEVRSGDSILDTMERLRSKASRLLYTLKQRGDTHLRRALLQAVDGEWFARRLPSHVVSSYDLLEHMARVTTQKSVVRKHEYSNLRSLKAREYNNSNGMPLFNTKETRKCFRCQSTGHLRKDCPLARKEVSLFLIES